VTIEIRTAAAWRTTNLSPLLRTLVATLPAAAAPHAVRPATAGR
jgi:hypothetical protein